MESWLLKSDLSLIETLGDTQLKGKDRKKLGRKVHEKGKSSGHILQSAVWPHLPPKLWGCSDAAQIPPWDPGRDWFPAREGWLLRAHSWTPSGNTHGWRELPAQVTALLRAAGMQGCKKQMPCRPLGYLWRASPACSSLPNFCCSWEHPPKTSPTGKSLPLSPFRGNLPEHTHPQWEWELRATHSCALT